jgi:CRISPR/Cas system-associated endonuclease/helicase Cas3
MKNKIWLVVNLLLLITFASFVFIEKSAAKDEEKWEYKVSPLVGESSLNTLGNEGWELIIVETVTSEGNWSNSRYIYKRKKK